MCYFYNQLPSSLFPPSWGFQLQMRGITVCTHSNNSASILPPSLLASCWLNSAFANFQKCNHCFLWKLLALSCAELSSTQFIFTRFALVSSDCITWERFLLHSYSKYNYTPLPQRRTCLYPSPFPCFEVFCIVSPLSKVCRPYVAGSSALFFPRSPWFWSLMQKVQCLRADTAFAFVADLS